MLAGRSGFSFVGLCLEGAPFGFGKSLFGEVLLKSLGVLACFAGKDRGFTEFERGRKSVQIGTGTVPCGGAVQASVKGVEACADSLVGVTRMSGCVCQVSLDGCWCASEWIFNFKVWTDFDQGVGKAFGLGGVKIYW